MDTYEVELARQDHPWSLAATQDWVVKVRLLRNRRLTPGRPVTWPDLMIARG
jgi:hypothetical protein